jgi:hypothetical protein
MYKMDTYFLGAKYITPDTSSYDLGCYKLPGDWQSDNLVKGATYTFVSKTMTRDLCSQTCVDKGAKYSAVRDTSCYCSASLNPGPGYYVPSDMCTRKCGGSNDICGDYYAVSIFNLANYKSSGATPTTSTPATSSAAPTPTSTPVLRGCVGDGVPRVLNSSWTYSASEMSPAFCANIARQAGRKLFAIENGGECFVGDSLSSANPSTQCNVACTGK